MNPRIELNRTQTAPLTKSSSKGPRQDASISATLNAAGVCAAVAGAAPCIVRADGFISLVLVRRRRGLRGRCTRLVRAADEVRTRRGGILIFLHRELHRIVDLHAHKARSRP